MINAIYGKKIGMTQVWDENDNLVPVTVILAEPNTVCQVKTTATDGYEAVQLGFGAVRYYKQSGDPASTSPWLAISPSRVLSLHATCVRFALRTLPTTRLATL